MAAFSATRALWKSTRNFQPLTASYTRTFSSFANKLDAGSNVSVLAEKRQLSVQLASGSELVYPFVYLKDNCQCSQCFHPVSKSRTVNLQKLDLYSQPVKAEVLNGELKIQWNDGHEGKYPASWLLEHNFTAEARKMRAKLYRSEREPWGAELLTEGKFPVADFEAILQNDEALFQWLRVLEVTGVCLVQNVPIEPGQVRRIAERVGFIRRTHYGEEYSVKAKADPNNVAYTGDLLQMHTDLPYYEYKPGINLLHCIIQYTGNGGENQLTDGVQAARRLKETAPFWYDVLKNTEVDWSDVGQENGHEFHTVNRAPVICERNGVVYRVNFSQPQRDSFLPLPLELVDVWYAALKRFSEIIQNEENMITLKVKPGEMLTFDNLRILHGRSAFGNDNGGERHIEGGYMDWDEARSRLRVLRTQFLSSGKQPF